MKINPAFFVSAAILSLFAFGSFTNEKIAENAFSDKVLLAGDTSARRIVINDEYSIMIKNHMTKATDLNDEASLQYSDIVEELYIIVIDEVSSEFKVAFQEAGDWDSTMTMAENYRRVQMASLKEALELKSKPAVQKTTFSKYPAEIVDFVGKVEGIEPLIFYKIGFIEREGKLYMIMTWTLDEMRSKHNTEMTNMVKSFRAE
jgi:hypothetical protein